MVPWLFSIHKKNLAQQIGPSPTYPTHQKIIPNKKPENWFLKYLSWIAKVLKLKTGYEGFIGRRDLNPLVQTVML